MERLADISQFESLMNARTVVENGWLGQKIADHIFSDPHTSKKKGNISNYDSVMKKANEVCREYGLSGDLKSAIWDGFEQFARFCYNINMDLAPAIQAINIQPHHQKGNAVFRGGETVGKTVRIPIDRKITEEKDYRKLVGIVSHELMHGLENSNRIVHRALLPLRMRWKRTIAPTLLGLPTADRDADGVLYPRIKINIKGRDRLRSLIARDWYAGILGGKGGGYNLDGYYPRDIFKLANSWEELAKAVYDWRKHNKILFTEGDFKTQKENDAKCVNKILNNPVPTSEYLTYFMTHYANKDKIPLLYALDVKRLINKINRMAGKQQNGKTS